MFFRDTRAGGGHAATLGGGCEPGSASRGPTRRGADMRGGEKKTRSRPGAPAGDRPTAVATEEGLVWRPIIHSAAVPTLRGVSRRSQGTNAGLVQPPAGAWRATGDRRRGLGRAWTRQNEEEGGSRGSVGGREAEGHGRGNGPGAHASGAAPPPPHKGGALPASPFGRSGLPRRPGGVGNRCRRRLSRRC